MQSNARTGPWPRMQSGQGCDTIGARLANRVSAIRSHQTHLWSLAPVRCCSVQNFRKGGVGMKRFEIIISRRRDTNPQLPPESRVRFWRWRSTAAAIAFAVVAIGLFVAAVLLGSVAAALVLILVSVAFIVAIVGAAVRRARR
jgi:hypothetical protein